MPDPLIKLPPSGGLHTRDDLTLVGRVHLAMRRSSRAFYRQMRHPRSRARGGWRKWFAEKIRNRALWRPERHAVAAGLAGGLFMAMMPVPLQSLLAAGVGVSRGWNLPATVSATWLSNPFTYVPMLMGARYAYANGIPLQDKYPEPRLEPRDDPLVEGGTIRALQRLNVGQSLVRLDATPPQCVDIVGHDSAHSGNRKMSA